MGGTPSLRKKDDLDLGLLKDKGVKKLIKKYSSRDARKYRFHQLSEISNIERLKNYGIIPLNVVHQIILFLPPPDHLEVTLSSKLFYNIGNTVLFWKEYCINTIGQVNVEKEIEKQKEYKDNTNDVNFKRFYFMRRKFFHKPEEYYIKRYKRKNWKMDNYVPFKVCLLGPTLSGKSSLVLRHVRKHFFKDQEPTIGAAFLTTTIGPVKLDIWDTAGEKRYKDLAPMYYRGASIICACFSLTDRQLYEEYFKEVILKEVVKEKQRNEEEGRREGFDQAIFLLGLKSDLEEERMISTQEGFDLAYHFGFENYIECSSKTGENVYKVFSMVAEYLEKLIEQRNNEKVNV